MKSLVCCALAALAPCMATASDEISLVRVIEPNSEARDVAVSPDGSTAVINTVSGLQFFDLATGNIVEPLDEDYVGCGFGQQSPDGRWLVLGCRDLSLLFDFTAREVVAEIETPYVRFAAFDRKQERLATMVLDSNSSYPKGKDAHFAIYDIEDLNDPSWLGSLWTTVFGVEQLDPDDEFSIAEPLGGFSSFQTMQFNNAQNRLLAANSKTVYTLSFDGKHDTSPREMSGEAPYFCGRSNVVAIDPVALRNTIDQIEARNTSPSTRFLHRYRYPVCRFSRDLSRAIFAYGGQLGEWDIARGKERWHYDDRIDAHYIDMTPDGSVIAIASAGHSVALLDGDGETIATGHIDGSAINRVMARYRSCDENQYRLTLSADGRTMLFNECGIYVLRRRP